MRRFVIERTMPGAGALAEDEWRAYAQKTNEVVDALAGRVQWVHSYVTADKLYCVYLADEAATLVEHAAGGGFAFDGAAEVRSVIDPTSAPALS